MGRDKDALEVKEGFIYFPKSDTKTVAHVLPQTIKCSDSLQAMVNLKNETLRFYFWAQHHILRNITLVSWGHMYGGNAMGEGYLSLMREYLPVLKN